ncbi:MAG: hypothetical protein ACTSYJ_08145 [Candidatus Thorarchaeota archaeon]
MRLAIFSRTPLAAAPWELFKALRKYTNLNVSLINHTYRYANGRIFPHHLLLNGAARAALRQADIWHVNNYWHRELTSFHGSQKVLAQFHSVPRLGNWHELMKHADVCYTINQPLQEKEYKLPALPNVIDPDEYRPIKRSSTIRIAFAPTTKLPPVHRSSKGYYEVKKILDEVARKRTVEIVWIEGKSYKGNLRLKQSCHILIDDVVTGNWHRTSLEGACFGCAVLNRVKKVPFVFANLDTLEEKLLQLIDSPAMLADIQERTRLWVLQNYHAIDTVQKYKKAYRRLSNAS